jgi:hypothetical protein
MVQDLKRSNSQAMRRRESALGIGANEDFGEMLGRRRTQDEENGGAGERGGAVVLGRGRSLSGTLGDFWTRVKGRGSREGLRDDGGEDRGPEER